MILLGLILVGGIFYLLSIKRVIQLPPPPEEEVVVDEIKGSVLVTSNFNPETKAVEVLIAPGDENSILLTAFALRGFISSDEGFASETTLNLVPNPDLTENNWNYLTKNTEVDEMGKLIIEVEATHRGEEVYTLEGETVIASIPVNGTYSGNLKTTLDEEVTVFLGKDVEVIYPYSSN